MRFDPIRQCRELIDNDYKIPIMSDISPHEQSDFGDFMTAREDNTIEVGKLIAFLFNKIEMAKSGSTLGVMHEYRLQKEKEKLLELLREVRELLEQAESGVTFDEIQLDRNRREVFLAKLKAEGIE